MNTRVTLILLLACNVTLADLPPLDRSAFGEKEILERRDKAEQAKLDLGAGDLERLALGSTKAYLEKAKMHKGANTDLLYKILKDERFRLKWDRTAITIAIVSDDKGLEVLRDYITSPLNENGYEMMSSDIRARTAAMLGLVGQYYERDIAWVKPFLLAHAKDETWRERNGYEKVDSKMIAKLTDAAMHAIAKMKTEDAMEMLGRIREQYISTENGSSKTQSLNANGGGKLDRIDTYIQVTKEIAPGKAKWENEMQSSNTN